MRYHLPITQNIEQAVLPTFVLRGEELVCPQKVYTKEQYPNLPSTMVKITGRNGQKIFVAARKLVTNICANEL